MLYTSESNLQNQVYNWSVIKPDEYSFVGNQYGQCVQLKTTTTTGLATLLTPQIVIDSDYYNNPDNDGHIMFAFFNFLHV